MRKLKTRERVRTIKALDKAAILSQRMKQASIRTKERTSALIDDNDSSSNQYAQEKIQNSVKDFSKESTRFIEKAMKKIALDAKRTKQREKASAKATKETGKAAKAAIHVMVKSVKSLAVAIASGETAAVLVVIGITLIALLMGSNYGIFFSSEEKTDRSVRMCDVIQEIEQEFVDRIDEIKESTDYDVLNLSGSHAAWQDVLAVYAVKTVSHGDISEVATVSDAKKALLRQVFGDMTSIDTEVLTTTSEAEDEQKNIVCLSISVHGKSTEEIAEEYGFTDEQLEQLRELMEPEYLSLWENVIYGS